MSNPRKRILAALNELFDMPVASRFGYESAVMDAIAIVERELPETDRVAELEAENQQLRELLGEFTRCWQPLNKLPNQQQKVWLTDGLSVWNDWTNRLDFDEPNNIYWMPYIIPATRGE